MTPAHANFVLGPAQRSFSQLGNNTDAVFTAWATGETHNPLDTTEYFVRQQYVDFLGREPDEAGLNFWVNNIQRCGNDARCLALKRTDTSAAFFLSIEFQQTFGGYNFWLDKLNTFNGNFRDAEMVKAFLVSSEYRGRFPR